MGTTPDVVQREDGSWLLDGLLPIDELKEILDIRKKLLVQGFKQWQRFSRLGNVGCTFILKGCLKRVGLSLKSDSEARSQIPKFRFSRGSFSVARVVKHTFEDFSNILQCTN
ncbi:MAG: hypothetical protein V7K55_24960 [Nostoc sp.]|uniref:hypothetical protein n=1 Tax=Nostoc sp. TaxID=1180 RepID=UPI002FFB51C5